MAVGLAAATEFPALHNVFRLSPKLYTGAAVNALTAATSQFSGTASNNFLVSAGTTYRVSVDSTGSAYTLAWSYQGVPNLNFTN